jgi:hypothetical protein
LEDVDALEVRTDVAPVPAPVSACCLDVLPLGFVLDVDIRLDVDFRCIEDRVDIVFVVFVLALALALDVDLDVDCLF